jgi:hypothetical protein
MSPSMGIQNAVLLRPCHQHSGLTKMRTPLLEQILLPAAPLPGMKLTVATGLPASGDPH